MNITIRPMTVDDYEQVHNVDILTQRQYLGVKFDRMIEEEKDSHLVSRKSEFQINVDTGYCFVAEDEKKSIVGFVLAHETLPFHGKLYIRYIGVKPEIQGQGIGELLYKKLIEKAQQTSIKEVVGLVNNDNPHSIRLFEKAGFKLNDRKQAILELNKGN
ncbi:MAG TPA: GNAT family N-acetyltransferase [Candidatus Saccharimonadales bacterium]|nr:GNAT family N-acetyltransferase [Candidatus Saccharimonadales bacterium]